MSLAVCDTIVKYIPENDKNSRKCVPKTVSKVINFPLSKKLSGEFSKVSGTKLSQSRKKFSKFSKVSPK